MDDIPYKIRLGYALTSVGNRIREIEDKMSNLESEIEALNSDLGFLSDLIKDENPSNS